MLIIIGYYSVKLLAPLRYPLQVYTFSYQLVGKKKKPTRFN